MLLLLFTEETKRWDWCLYETGLFMDIYENGGHSKPIVYFYKKDRPGPLKNIQGVELNREEVFRFLEKFFHATTQFVPGVDPLAPQLRIDTIDSIAKEMCDIFHAEPEISYSAVHQIVVDFPPLFRDVGELIPEDAEISRTGEDALRIFDLAAGKHKWGEIVTKQENDMWITEIGRAVLARYYDRRVPYPTTSVRSIDGKQHYLPILQSVNKAGSVLVGCQIMMISVDRFCEACPKARAAGKPYWISWAEYWELLTDLAGRLKKYSPEYTPDVILGLSHGGMAFGDFLIHRAYFGSAAGMPTAPIASFWIDRSGDRISVDNSFNRAIIEGLRSVLEEKGKLEVLLVDDYVSQGETVELTIKYLEANIPQVSVWFLPLFAYGDSGLKRNRDHFFWFNTKVDVDIAEEAQVYEIHKTEKHVLPYGKDMMDNSIKAM